MKSYTVIGLGRFGSCVAQQLYQADCEVLAMDIDAAQVQKYADKVTRAVVGDATDKEVLQALGVQDCDCAIVASGSNLTSSVLSVMNLKELGVPYIICKAQNETYRKVLEKLGADQVIIPEWEIGVRLAQSLSSHNVMEYIDLSADYGIAEVKAPSSWLGKTIRQLNIRAEYQVNIIAIRRKENFMITFSPDDVLQKGDVLVLLGSYSALERIQNL